MNDYVLTCCSTADLSLEHFQDRQIKVLPFHFELNGVHYLDDLGQTVSFETFYQALADGAETKTSQANVNEYVDFFSDILAAGKDILHVCLSSGLSGTYNSACIATEMLKEQFPDRKLLIVDSLGASSGYGLIMDKLADLRDEGRSIDAVYQWALDNRLRMHHWFFLTDLSFYVKGGRISKTAGLVGGILGICPLLSMDLNGKLVPRYKIRTKKKVIAAIVKNE